MRIKIQPGKVRHSTWRKSTHRQIMISARRLTATFAAVLVLVVLSPRGAWASETGTVFYGDTVIFKGPNSAFGYLHWKADVDQIQGIKVVPDLGFGTSGWCLDSIFDWKTSDGEHWDSRRVRTCNGGVTVLRSRDDTNAYRSLTQMQKAGVCYGPDQATNTQSAYCSEDSRRLKSVVRLPGSESGPNPVLPNYCTMSWRVEAASSLVYYGDGGNMHACDE